MSRLLVAVAALACGSRLTAAEPVSVTKTDAALEVRVGGELFTRYRFAGTVADPKGTGTKPLAKPYFWPVLAPGQLPVTRPWPLERGAPGETTDHFHQKSVWFCHGDVIPEGVELRVRSSDKHVKGVDFWSENPGHGRIVCTEVGEPKAVAAGHVAVPTRNDWVAPDGTKVLSENRTLHFVALPAGRLVVLDIELTPAAGPVVFGDTKEGAMGVRVPDGVRLASKGGGTITSSTGATATAPAKDDLPLWGEVADWHDYGGAVDGKPAGLAVFADPGNPARSSWHTRAYGLMAANPFGRAGSGFPSQKGKTDPVRVAAGERLRLRFGVYAHAGDAAAGRVAEAFRAFAGMR